MCTNNSVLHQWVCGTSTSGDIHNGGWLEDGTKVNINQASETTDHQDGEKQPIEMRGVTRVHPPIMEGMSVVGGGIAFELPDGSF